MKFVHKIESALRVGRAFHIDADEAGRVHGRRFCDESADDVASQSVVHVESHVGQFETDIGVELVSDDRVENLKVELRAVAGFIGIGDIFAKVVDADAHAGAVYRLGGADRIDNLSAGNEAAGEAASEGGAFGRSE